MGAADAVLTFDRADFQLTTSLLPPPDGSPWKPVSLPDNWNHSLPGLGGNGWYRFEFQVNDRPQTLQAIYFARASMTATVLLNGNLVDNSGGLFESGVRNWNRPFLIQFLPRQLQKGRNELLVRVDARADDMGGLSVVELGSAALLAPAYQQRRFIQLVIPQISGVLIALSCLATFVVWLYLRDPQFGYFTLASAAYFIRQIEYIVSDIPLSGGWVQLGVATTVCWFVIFLTLFSVHLFKQSWPRAERYLLVLAGLIGVVLFAFGASPWSAPVAIGLHVIALVLGLGTLVTLMPKVGLIPYVESLPLAGAAVITFMLGVHDVLQRMGVLLTNTPRLSHLGIPVLFFTMFLIIVSRYVRNIKLLTETNEGLEQKATEKAAELVGVLQVQTRMQSQQAVMQERELILREMHDGVGNYLTIALRAAARPLPDMPILNGALKNCMLDLRLMIDSLAESDSGADTVATVLGNLRYRIEPALTAEGIELVWAVQEVEIFTALTPRNVLNLTRIFQEALTNVIKHAQATRVVLRSEMRVRDTRRWAVITLSDNGSWGIPSDGGGYGQGNMRRRAAQLDGELQVKCTAEGSMVELSIPEERRIRPRESASSPETSDQLSSYGCL